MNAAVICFSDAGAETAKRISSDLGASIHSTPKYAEKYGFIPHKSIMADGAELFNSYRALIFIGSCGIAVRCIARHIKSKETDPAVIVVDDEARYVIPVLSGHIGGANALAKRLAGMLGAVPVITTATDIHGRFACDEWAVNHYCVIGSLKAAKEISSAILTEDIPVSSEFALPEKLPSGLYKCDSGSLGIYIGTKKTMPYGVTLSLIPRVITVGIGCRRGTPETAILSAINRTLEKHGIDKRAVRLIASIDLKKDEQGLLDAAASMNVPIAFYTAGQLNSVPGEFAESEFVKKTTGTGNVCERACAYGGGTVIAHKEAIDGVTVAVARDEWEISF